MRVAIFDKIIRNNIELFKKLIIKQIGKKEKLHQPLNKTYAAFVNRKTGEMRFVEWRMKKKSLVEWNGSLLVFV